MKLIIDIPEKYYENDNLIHFFGCYSVKLDEVIKNGTPLPKGHGRLIDGDALEEEILGGINAGLMINGYEDYSNINDTEDCLECVKYADTIIEADKAESEE